MTTRTVVKRKPLVGRKTTKRIEVVERTFSLANLLTQVAYVLFAIFETLLLVRFVLKLIGVDPFNNGVTWIYNTTSLLVLPFESLSPNPNNGGAMLEISTILAMISYLVVFYGIVASFHSFVHEEQVVDPEGNYGTKKSKSKN
jgi:hypothetical protein